MIHASDDAEEDRIVFVCTKNNNGSLGVRTAWQRHQNFFKVVEDFDWKEFETPVLPGSDQITKETLDELFEGGSSKIVKKVAVQRLHEDFGFRKTAAYNALKLGPDAKFGDHLSEREGLLIWHPDGIQKSLI